MKIGKIIGLSLLALSLIPSIATKVLADGGDATLIHGCVAKDGTTRIVSPTTACKNSETPRHWPTEARIVTDENRITNTENKNTTQDAAISAIQTKNTQQDADIAALQGQVGGGSSGLVVKDSLGQTMGKFWGDLGGSALFFRPVNNEPLLFAVKSSGFESSFIFEFLYTTNNCTGTRYRFSERGRLGRLYEFVQTSDSQTGYFSTLPASPLLIQSVEQFQPGEDASGIGLCVATSNTEIVGEVSSINLLTLGTPPFRLE